MLRVEDLSVAYGSVRALDGVSLEVKQSGALHGIIGPNGAGKSTLMDAITGRRKPTRGRVFVDGRDITALSVARRRRLGRRSAGSQSAGRRHQRGRISCRATCPVRDNRGRAAARFHLRHR